jgi:hypothetical protein
MPPRTAAAPSLRCRAPLGVQRQIDWTKLYESFCPPPLLPKSYSSSGIIDTTYGKWLGLKDMEEFNATPYGLVDFYVWRRDSWWGGTIFDLYKYDPGVALALTNQEYTRRGLRRTDILNAELDEVYEIKPVSSAEEGPSQLADYLQQLQLTASTTSPLFPPGDPGPGGVQGIGEKIPRPTGALPSSAARHAAPPPDRDIPSQATHQPPLMILKRPCVLVLRYALFLLRVTVITVRFL